MTRWFRSSIFRAALLAIPDVRTASRLPRTLGDHRAFHRVHHATVWLVRNGAETREVKSLHREIAYIDASGREQLKVADGRVATPGELRNAGIPITESGGRLCSRADRRRGTLRVR